MKYAMYFGATWCMPCKQFKPIVKDIANSGYDIQFYDIDDDILMAKKYGIHSVPTIVIIKNGLESDRIIGCVSKEDLLSKLK